MEAFCDLRILRLIFAYFLALTGALGTVYWIPTFSSVPLSSALFTDKSTGNKDLEAFTHLLSVLLIYLSCAPVAAQHSSRKANVVLPPERVPNLGKVKQLLKAYYDMQLWPLHRRHERASWACNRVLGKARSSSTARRETGARVGHIDDTSLSNYSFYETTDMGHITRLFDQWVQSAQAPAIESTMSSSEGTTATGGRLLHQWTTRGSQGSNAAESSNTRVRGLVGVGPTTDAGQQQECC
jgi:hypothetical protein